jgi:aspartyl-tRNA(Asn)/glutamyl-tRNA(Gln) amidotransferase subunit A
MTQRKYADFMRAVAEFRGYPFQDRAEQWEARIAFNAPDMETLFHAAAEGDPVLLPPRAAVRASPPPAAPAAALAKGELESSSIAQIAAQVTGRKLAPVDIARHFLDRIQAQQALNAFITVDPAQVLAQAEQLGQRVARGENIGPLAGVPVAVKDLMSVQGYPLTGGTRSIDPLVQTTDAPVVARLRAAGALIVGTANLHELAFGVTSANPHFGTVQNPRFPGRIPGGSSGGSAAAVAAGLANIGVGTDTGGSIRQPACCCAIVGFKPSYDAVPRDGVIPLAWTLDHIGPLCRTVEDTASAFEVMAGLAHRSMLTDGVRAPKIARPGNFFFEMLEPAVAERIEAALTLLGGAGANLVPSRIEGMDLAPGIQFMTIASEATRANWDNLTQRGAGMGDDVRVRFELGQFILAIDYVKAQQLRRQVRDAVIASMNGCDVMVTPVMPAVPPPAGVMSVTLNGKPMHVAPAMTRFTSPINFCGLPALSLPCGLTREGLPVSLQIVGRPGEDARVLSVGRFCERVPNG